MKNEQRAKLAKRTELPRVKLKYAPNCRAPNWHCVEVGRAKLVRVKLARIKKDAPNRNDSGSSVVRLRGSQIAQLTIEGSRVRLPVAPLRNLGTFVYPTLPVFWMLHYKPLRVKLARAKHDVPNWTVIQQPMYIINYTCTRIHFNSYKTKIE